jgi:signal transduction histidine kinase
MRERTDLVDGTVSIESSAVEETTVRAVLPTRRGGEAETAASNVGA